MTDFKWAISIHRLMLRSVGLWPQDTRDSRQILGIKLRRTSNFLALFFVLAAPLLISLIKVWGNMTLMIDNMQYSLPVTMTLSKVCIIWHKQEVLAPLIDMVERDWMKVKMKEERAVMLRRASFTRMVALCGMSIIVLAVIIICGYPYIQMTIRYVTNQNYSEKFLPIQMYYPHDITKSPQFELTFLAQIFSIIVGCLSYTGVDNLLGLLVLHICGQLENLYSRLIYIGKYPNFNAILKYNIQDHIRLIRSIRIIDDTFHLMLLGLVFYFTIIFCLLGFLIVNVLNGKSQVSHIKLIWFGIESISIMLHMCLYCIVGEILVTQSEIIHHATYEYEWYTLEPKGAKNFILIMLQASKPLYITAGKMFPMTMATFCSLMKTSAGYISVLLATQE